MMKSADKLGEAVVEEFRQKVKDLADDLNAQEVANIDTRYFSFVQNDMKEAERSGYSNYSYWGSTLRMFLKNKMGITTFFILIILIGFSLIQPFLPNQKLATYINQHSVLRSNGQYYDEQIRNHPPFNKEFWFGTNAIGQDLWARIWSGTRTSLRIGVTVAFINMIIGIFYGMIWGYVRKLDWLLTEFWNVINNIPNTIILILMSFILRPGVGPIIFAMCIYGWVGMARLIRNLTVIIRDREFNLASNCLGSGVFKIILRNLLPQMISIITLHFALAIPGAIGSEVFLAYLGLGLDVKTPSLGNLLNTGRGLMMAPTLRYQLFFPATILCIISVCFYLMGNAFSDSADPRNHV
jgi:oligopeptide transport system permease protein